MALPIVLRRATVTVSPSAADDRLVILTPHNDSIRNEFGEAFARHWKEKTGRTLYVDWRTPGGTAEIRMVLDAGFEAAEESGRAGVGVDVLFGGGTPDFSSQAKRGRLLPLRVFDTQAEWFSGPEPVIPQSFTGEAYYPDDRVWISTCMSQFGVCHNPDYIRRLGVNPPEIWDDLADPLYAGTIALADPTKSGSISRCFELLIQDQIQRRLRDGMEREAACEAGWRAGWQLVQRMAANARYFTDSASKIPQDVGQGNAAAGMAIDLYGRSFGAGLSTRDGSPRLVWKAPLRGTTLSGDPVGVLKGAPHEELAQEFVEFIMGPDAQRLWFQRPGTSGGPQLHALHRTPIRTDLYTPEILALTTMPEVDPYHDPGNFTYDPALTGAAFNTVRQLVKAMCIDSHQELTAAWRDIIAAGMPAEALAVMQDMSIVPYRPGGGGDPGLDSRDSVTATARAAEIGAWFRNNYRTARDIANKRVVAAPAIPSDQP